MPRPHRTTPAWLARELVKMRADITSAPLPDVSTERALGSGAVRCTWALVGGALVLRGHQVDGGDAPEGVSSKVLRMSVQSSHLDLHREEAVGRFVESAALAAEATGRPTSGPVADAVRDVSTARPAARRGRPPTYGDAHFDMVAALYRLGSSGGAPVQLVAAAYEVPASTARGWVERARKKGKLEPTDSGRTKRGAPYPRSRRTNATNRS